MPSRASTQSRPPAQACPPARTPARTASGIHAPFPGALRGGGPLRGHPPHPLRRPSPAPQRPCPCRLLPLRRRLNSLRRRRWPAPPRQPRGGGGWRGGRRGPRHGRAPARGEPPPSWQRSGPARTSFAPRTRTGPCAGRCKAHSGAVDCERQPGQSMRSRLPSMGTLSLKGNGIAHPPKRGRSECACADVAALWCTGPRTFMNENIVSENHRKQNTKLIQ